MSDPHLTIWIGREPFDTNWDVRFNWHGQAGGRSFGPRAAMDDMAVALALAGLEPAPADETAAIKAEQDVGTGEHRLKWMLRDKPAKGLRFADGEAAHMLEQIIATDPHARTQAANGRAMVASLSHWREPQGAYSAEVHADSPLSRASLRALCAIGILGINGAEGRQETSMARYGTPSASVRAAARLRAPRALRVEAVLRSAGQPGLADMIALQAERPA